MARALLTQAIEAEVSTLLSCHAEKLTADGRHELREPRDPLLQRFLAAQCCAVLTRILYLLKKIAIEALSKTWPKNN
jgi:hypothetical protein